MSFPVPVPMILDGLTIILLAGTIFYCIRLSVYLKSFRDSRGDLEKLIHELSDNIIKAEHAIDGLRNNARESGRDLQETINEAKGLSEELQIMSESGNSLAGRLEKLADKTGRVAESYRSPMDFEMPERPTRRRAPVKTYQEPEPEIVREPMATPLAGFAIRDREYEEDPEGFMDEQGLLGSDYEEENAAQFSSRAEQDLYEALRHKKKSKMGAGGVS